MSRPLLTVSQSDYLIQVLIQIHTLNAQTVQIQISWIMKKLTDLDLLCLQSRVKIAMFCTLTFKFSKTSMTRTLMACLFAKHVCFIYFFLKFANLEYRISDISKYFRVSLELRDKEHQLFFLVSGKCPDLKPCPLNTFCLYYNSSWGLPFVLA